VPRPLIRSRRHASREASTVLWFTGDEESLTVCTRRNLPVQVFTYLHAPLSLLQCFLLSSATEGKNLPEVLLASS